MDSTHYRASILCFLPHYLPGYRSGGPVRTIVNFVDHLGDEFDIRIVTKDRDALDTESYKGVAIDKWNTVGKAKVFYASEKTVTLRGISRLLRETPHDVLYLNSFFAFGFTGLPLLARKLRLSPRMPCVLAPRGEFSPGAIALKSWKKRPYMVLAKAVGLYSRLSWQASSPVEAEYIQSTLGDVADRVLVAPDLPPRVQPADSADSLEIIRRSGRLRMVFLSRISPMKNLDFLLEILARVKSQVAFVIYGPIREPEYWNRCKLLISKMPSNVLVEYRGEVTPSYVNMTFSASDLFVFPTRGENYGHVVLEALVAGTSVLISDRTPWRASEDKAVDVLGLEEPEAWVQAIEHWAKFDDLQFARMRTAATSYAQHYLETSGALNQNRALFHGVLEAAQKSKSQT